MDEEHGGTPAWLFSVESDPYRTLARLGRSKADRSRSNRRNCSGTEARKHPRRSVGANGVLYSIRRDATNSLHSPARAMENIRCGGKQCQRTFQERLWILAIKSDFLEAAATVPNAVDPTFILHCNRILRKFCIQMRYVWSEAEAAFRVGRFRFCVCLDTSR